MKCLPSNRIYSYTNPTIFPSLFRSLRLNTLHDNSNIILVEMVANSVSLHLGRWKKNNEMWLNLPDAYFERKKQQKVMFQHCYTKVFFLFLLHSITLVVNYRIHSVDSFFVGGFPLLLFCLFCYFSEVLSTIKKLSLYL